MDKEIIVKLHKNFEDCAHNINGVEFWYARELQGLLGYDEWRNFESVVKKAKIACENAGQKINDHFVDANKTIPMPKGASKEIQDIMLTRYACYLIAQNGDSRKDKLGVPGKRALADFLPGVTIKAKDLANEITSFNVN